MTARAFALWMFIAFFVGAGACFAVMARVTPEGDTAATAAQQARADSLAALQLRLDSVAGILKARTDSIARIARADSVQRAATRREVVGLRARLAAFDTASSVPRDTAEAWLLVCEADATAADRALASCAAEKESLRAERDTAQQRTSVALEEAANRDSVARTRGSERDGARREAARAKRFGVVGWTVAAVVSLLAFLK